MYSLPCFFYKNLQKCDKNAKKGRKNVKNCEKTVEKVWKSCG